MNLSRSRFWRVPTIHRVVVAWLTRGGLRGQPVLCPTSLPFRLRCDAGHTRSGISRLEAASEQQILTEEDAEPLLALGGDPSEVTRGELTDAGRRATETLACPERCQASFPNRSIFADRRHLIGPRTRRPVDISREVRGERVRLDGPGPQAMRTNPSPGDRDQGGER